MSGARKRVNVVRVHERHECLARPCRDVLGDRRPLRIHRGTGHLDAPQQGDGVELLDHEIRSDAPDMRAKHAHCRGDVELLEMQQCKMPSVVTMDGPAAGRKQWQE